MDQNQEEEVTGLGKKIQFKFYRFVIILVVIVLFSNNILPHPGDLLTQAIGIGTSADFNRNGIGMDVVAFNFMYYVTGIGMYTAIIGIVIFSFNACKEKDKEKNIP